MEALFGGSFDPVHVGHLIVAETAAETLGMPVRFLPAREQPLKRTGHGASPEQRAEMLELAVAGNPHFRVDRIELDLPPPSYTVRTLRTLVQREPGNRFALLVGADAAADLPRWAEVEALAQMVELIGFPRPGTVVPAGPIRRTIDVPAVAISASAIRQRVAQGQSIRYLVPDAVREYIATRRLYR